MSRRRPSNKRPKAKRPQHKKAPEPKEVELKEEKQEDEGPPFKCTIVGDDGKPHVYVCEPYPARLSLEIQGRLGWACGPIIGGVAEVYAGEMETIPGIAVGEACSRVFNRLLVTEGADIFLDLLSHTARDGEKIATLEAFDAVYTYNQGELYAVAGWLLEVNFKRLAARLPFASILGRLVRAEGFKSGWRQFTKGSPRTSSPDSPSTSTLEDSDSTPSSSAKPTPSGTSPAASTS